MTVRKWGGESLVNTNVLDDQSEPVVTVLSNGSYVIAWTDIDPLGGDGIGSSIKFQRFDATGVKLGGEVIANSDAFGFQDKPDIAATTDGGFVITWAENSITNEYRQFDVNGVANSADLAVPGLPQNEFVPAVARVGTGFAIAFQDNNQGSGNQNIQVQNFLANGDPIGILIPVAASANREIDPAIVGSLDGTGLVVVWDDDTTDHIRIRGFTSAGFQTFAAVDVSDATGFDVSEASVTVLANGSYLVAWRSEAPAAPDTNAQILGRIVQADGTIVGSEFVITTETAGIAQLPDVAALPDGGFVAVYRSGEIRGQVFDAFGARKGAEFFANVSEDDGQSDPSVAALADGRFVVTWTDSSDNFDDDTDGNSIRQQIFDPRDGVVEGAGGSQTLFGHDNVADEINGHRGDDLLFGLGGNDSLYGGDGNDTLDGGAGDDLLFGGTDDDTYVLGSGNDKVQDDAGIDTVTSTVSRSLAGLAAIEKLVLLAGANAIGNALANTLTGNAGANLLNGLGGADTMFGRAGNDVYFVDNALDTVNETGGSGVDLVISGVNFNLANTARAVGAVENLTLVGTATVGLGNAFANTITGNALANALSGVAGNDRLLGGAGNDGLTGGAGNDIFVFNTAPNTATNRDIVADFNHIADTFQLENAVFTKLGAGVHALNPAFFRVGAAAADANDFIVYNQANGLLLYDVNGNAAGGAIAFAVLANRPVLAANDFVVI
jgi:Ca2+-binding RTX toxin-like protein